MDGNRLCPSGASRPRHRTALRRTGSAARYAEPLGAVSCLCGKLTLPLLVVAHRQCRSGTLLVRRLRRRVLRDRAKRLIEEGHIGETIATYERLLQLNRSDVEPARHSSICMHRKVGEQAPTGNEVIARLEPDNLHALSYLGKQQFAERRFVEPNKPGRNLTAGCHMGGAFFYMGQCRPRGPGGGRVHALQRALSLAITGHGRSLENRRRRRDRS